MHPNSLELLEHSLNLSTKYLDLTLFRCFFSEK